MTQKPKPPRPPKPPAAEHRHSEFGRVDCIGTATYAEAGIHRETRAGAVCATPPRVITPSHREDSRADTVRCGREPQFVQRVG
jgi:hypothetical protein